MVAFNPTDEQVNAIEYSESMVVTACPGSGKTAVMVRKIKNMISELPSYRGVIAISYTNKASEELRTRCKNLTPDIKQSFFGTIDGFCIQEIILPFIKHLWGVAQQEIEIRRYASLDEEQKRKLPSLGDNEALKTSLLSEIKDELRAHYLSGFILLEAVGILSVYILEHSGACARYLKSRYSHIFIDEYQDSGEPQHAIFMLIKAQGIIGVAVGDLKQSIYAFAGRRPEYLRSLTEQNSGFSHFELTQNHRCHPSIVNYSNRLNNATCELLPSRELRVFRKKVNGDQIEIGKWIENNLAPIKHYYNVEHNSQCAVLVRSNASAEIVKKGLSIPTRMFFDIPLSLSTSIHSRLFLKLLDFRNKMGTTSQNIIDEFSRNTLSRTTERELRRLIQKCRDCTDENLIEYASSVAESLTLSAVEESEIRLLRETLSLNRYHEHFGSPHDTELQIMTLHKAKGLQFKIVFHLDLYDWILPQREFVKNSNEIIFKNEQQCLNLHYVGITRAEQACYLIESSNRVNKMGKFLQASPSQFLERNGLKGLFTAI